MQIATLLHNELAEYLTPYDQAQQAVIEEYWESICFTRKSGRISVNIIKNEMAYWQRFKPEHVIAGLQVHIKMLLTEKYDYKERYTRGIIRNIANDPSGFGAKKHNKPHYGGDDGPSGIRDLNFLIE